MTNWEALLSAKQGLIVYETQFPHLTEQINFQKIVISALKKQIPQAAEHEDGAWSICPNCGGSICNDTEYAVNKEVSYCEHCGQAIDWENSEME